MTITISPISSALPAFSNKHTRVPLPICERIALFAKILFKTIFSMGFCWLSKSLKSDWDLYKAGRKIVTIDQIEQKVPPKVEPPEDVLNRLENENRFYDADLALLVEKRPHLVHLNLSHTKVTDAGLVHLKKLKSLRSLDLSYSNYNPPRNDVELTGVGFAHLIGHPSLQKVNFAHSIHITDECLTYFSQIPGLQSIDLTCCFEVTDAGLVQLAKLKNLKELNLSCCTQVTDQTLSLLKKFPALVSLVLETCKITNEALVKLKDIPRLKALSLLGCDKITTGLSELGYLPGLEELTLCGLKNVTPAVMGALKSLKNLKVLDLGWTDITDEGMAHLQTFHNLESLNLYGCSSISDKGLLSLKGLHALKSLTLSHCHLITDEGLDHLKDLKSLQLLNLAGCKVTDKGVAIACADKKLRELRLYKCPLLTDLVINHIKQLKELEILYLSECVGLTNAGIKGLLSLDSLKIIYLKNIKLTKDTVDAFQAKGIKVFHTSIFK